ncbi:DUF2905 family protein [Pontibacter rugosus]
MQPVGKTIVIVGVILVVVGIVVWLAGDKFSWFGQLPGDIRVEKKEHAVFCSHHKYAFIKHTFLFGDVADPEVLLIREAYTLAALV